jgi:hypothetical protein
MSFSFLSKDISREKAFKISSPDTCNRTGVKMKKKSFIPWVVCTREGAEDTRAGSIGIKMRYPSGQASEII